MHRTLSLPLSAIGSAALGCVSLNAQSQLSLPSHADITDGQHSLAQPFGTRGFRTQILVESVAIAPTGAVLNSIAFRTDRQSAPLAPGQVPNVTVELSHTNTFITGMSPTFASNVTSPPTVVFQGTVNLPAANAGLAGAPPWDIVITFPVPYVFTAAQGNLLIDITGNNPPASGFPDRYLDAMQGGGAVTYFGTGGSNPNDTLWLGVYAGNGTTREVSPGNNIHFSSQLMIAPMPGVLALGSAPQPVPIDLAPIGAPTNFLYIDPILLSAHNWTQTWIGWFSDFAVPVPGGPALVGALLYGQSSILEPAANPLGLVLTAAVEVRIGDQNEQLPLQQLNAADPTAAIGTLVDFSYTTTPDYGSVPIRFDGTFF